MSSGLLPGNRTWRCEVEDVRHYNKYFMTLTSERGDVETSRARTFFLSSGVSQWNQSLSALNLVPILVNGTVMTFLKSLFPYSYTKTTNTHTHTHRSLKLIWTEYSN